MLNADVLRAAIPDAHAECESADGCVHADAVSHLNKEVQEVIARDIAIGIESGNPAFAIFVGAFHIGYRAAQLQALADSKQTVQ